MPKAEWNNQNRNKVSVLLRFLVLLVLFLRLGSAEIAQGTAEPKSILLLDEDSPSRPVVVNFMTAFRPEVVKLLNRSVTIYTENLDFGWFSSEAYKEKLSKWLQDKYGKHRLDAIVVGDETALRYALTLREGMWPDLPIVFTGLDKEGAQRFSDVPNLTGVTIDFDVKGTLKAVARFFPKMRSIAYVAGVRTPYKDLERYWMKDTKEFAEGRYDWIDLTEYSLTETKSLLKTLPPNTVVFYAGISVDGEENRYGARDLIPELSRIANSPMFSCLEPFVGYGTVGGVSMNPSILGVEMARQVASVIVTGNASTVPVVKSNANVPVFDWRELKRWNLDERDAPKGSELRQRTPSIWEAYGDTIIAVLFVMICLLTLIALLLWQRRERRIVENSLRESEEHMMIASESAGLGLWIWRPEDDRIWCTDALNSFYGFPLEQDLTGKDCISRIHPEDMESYHSIWTRMTRHNPYAEIEFRVVLPESKIERWLSSKGRGTFDINGNLLRLMGVTVNITETKLMAKEIQQRQDQLSHAMRVATMGELAGSLAHELNQPLAAIMNNAQAGRRFLNSPVVDLEEMRELISDIIADNERASQVIQRLYPLLRNEEPTFHRVSVNTVVVESAKFLRSSLTSRGVTLAVELEPDLPPVNGDRVQLQQVLINLCLNGAEAMIGLLPHESHLRVRTIREDETIRVSVEDCGHGLTQETLDRVFEPFHSSKPNGLGMGLSISKSIVQAHKGKIWLESNLSGGATAHFILPIAKTS